MKYFLDCEFHEDGHTIDLISIGIVAEDGREFYAVNADCNWDRIWGGVTQHDRERTAWLRDNVMPQIDRSIAIPRTDIRDQVRDFVLFQPKHVPSWCPVEFWGYYAATDWVALYQLWGRLIDIPPHFPKWCRDIKQFAASVGNPTLPYDPKIHHALEDARWQKLAYDFMVEHAKQKADEERVRLPLQMLGIK